VIGTHGRSIWILDDVTPLRQLSAEMDTSEAWLFKPQSAVRVRPGSFEGTPLPPEEPQGENPPDGAAINYYLKAEPSGPIVLEILDNTGKLVRRYSGAEKPPPVDPKTLDIPAYWIQPAQSLSTAPGMHRFFWDMHYAAEAPTARRPGATRGGGAGPWAPPGHYAVRLTVGSRSYTQPLMVKMDPRVKTPLPDLMKQFTMAQQIAAAQTQLRDASREANRLHCELQSLRAKINEQPALASAVEALDKKVTTLTGPQGPAGFGFEEPVTEQPTMRSVTAAWGALDRAVESADVAPTRDAVTAFEHDQKLTREVQRKWDEIKTKDLVSLNAALSRARLPALSLEGPGNEREASKN